MENDYRNEFTVNGFIFGSKKDVELAESELSTIRYIEKKIENRSADTILSVYQGAIERRLFRTPLGYSYLRDLQKRLISMGVDKSKITGIPLLQVYGSLLDDEADERKDREVTLAKRKRRDKLRKENLSLKIAVFVLALLVIGMFIISLNASAPNILNYRRVIENEYSQWNEELNSRENTIREKERELKIEYNSQNDEEDID